MHQVWYGCMLQGTQVDDPDVALTRKPSDSEPFSALAFKIMSDAYQGTLTFIRVYSGILEQVGSPRQGTKVCTNLRCNPQNQAGIMLASRAELAGLPGRAACRSWATPHQGTLALI